MEMEDRDERQGMKGSKGHEKGKENGLACMTIWVSDRMPRMKTQIMGAKIEIWHPWSNAKRMHGRRMQIVGKYVTVMLQQMMEKQLANF